MSEPTPTPTQVQHPWRATLRTVVAIIIGLASVLPYLVAGAGIPVEGAVAQILAVAAGVTRVLAIPAVQGFVAEYLPWLSATPRQP